MTKNEKKYARFCQLVEASNLQFCLLDTQDGVTRFTIERTAPGWEPCVNEVRNVGKSITNAMNEFWFDLNSDYAHRVYVRGKDIAVGVIFRTKVDAQYLADAGFKVYPRK